MRYLRLIQGALLPATPGTVVRPEGELTLEGGAPPGGRVELAMTVENRQRVFCMLTPGRTMPSARDFVHAQRQQGASTRSARQGRVPRLATRPATASRR